MKREGQIMQRVVEPENLRLAFWKAARGKWQRTEVGEYADNLGVELERLRQGLLGGDYPVGQFRRFVVHEPKERVVYAAAFRGTRASSCHHESVRAGVRAVGDSR